MFLQVSDDVYPIDFEKRQANVRKKQKNYILQMFQAS